MRGRHRAPQRRADKAADYERVADEWQASVERWTATTNGPYSAKPYYLRVTKDGEPDDAYDLLAGRQLPPARRSARDRRPGFLALTLFGIKPWDDQVVRNSLAVGDEKLAVRTPSGTVWHRFTFDGYGEQADGGDWDLFTSREEADARPAVAAAGRRARRVRAAGGPRRAAALRTIATPPTTA